MKKLLLTSVSLFSVGMIVNAQSMIAGDTKKFKPANEVSVIKSKSNASGKAAASNWYEPWNMAGKAGAETSWVPYVNFLFPDSIVKYIDEAGTLSYMPGSTNIGQVLDPKDANIALTDNPEYTMSKFTSYTLDSLYFSYLYVRNVDSLPDDLGNKIAVVDTLLIDYFITSALQMGGFQVGLEKFARPGFNTSLRRPTGMSFTQKVLLTRADSTAALPDATGNPESSWRTGVMGIAVSTPLSINSSRMAAQNIVGFSMRFKPGHSYDTSSIMVYQKAASTFPSGATRANYFGYRFYANGTGAPYPPQVEQTTYINNTLVAGKQSSYATSGWVGFVPGNAYYAHQYFQCGFQLTSSNIGINEVKNPNFELGDAYPNPTTGITTFDFNLKNASDVKISIVNLVGQEVLSVANNKFNAGVNEVRADLSSLTSGVYLYTMTVDGQSQSQKLIISK